MLSLVDWFFWSHVLAVGIDITFAIVAVPILVLSSDHTFDTWTTSSINYVIPIFVGVFGQFDEPFN